MLLCGVRISGLGLKIAEFPSRLASQELAGDRVEKPRVGNRWQRLAGQAPLNDRNLCSSNAKRLQFVLPRDGVPRHTSSLSCGNRTISPTTSICVWGGKHLHTDLTHPRGQVLTDKITSIRYSAAEVRYLRGLSVDQFMHSPVYKNHMAPVGVAQPRTTAVTKGCGLGPASIPANIGSQFSAMPVDVDPA